MVAKRLVRILTMLALLIAPLGMMGGSAAVAQAAAVASGSHHEQAADMPAHCAEMGETHGEEGGFPQADCLSDCAVSCAAISALGTVMADHAILPSMAQARAFADPLHGLSPESADPPPRTA